MFEEQSFDETVMGLLLKDDAKKYDPQHPLWSFNWLWLTQGQFNAIIQNQTKCYRIDDKMFNAHEVRIARKFTYQELRKENPDWKTPVYLLEALQAEREAKKIAEV